MKKIAIIAGFFSLLVFLALEYYVQTPHFSAKIRPLIVIPLREAFGPDARIGLVKAHALPLYIEVRDIVISDSSGSPSFTIRKIRAYINPAALLLKRLNISSITVLEPRLQVHRLKSGTTKGLEFIDRIKAFLKEDTGGTSGFRVDAESIAIQRGTLSFSDDALSLGVRLADIALTVRPGVDRMKITVKKSTGAMNLASYPELKFGMQGAAVYDRERIAISSLELKMPDAAVSASGFAGIQDNRPLHLTVKGAFGFQTLGIFSQFLKKNRTQSRGPSLDFSVDVQGTIREPVVSGSLKAADMVYNGAAIDKAGLSFSWENRAIMMNGAGWTLSNNREKFLVDRFVAVLLYRDSGFDIGQLYIAAGDLDMSLAGRIDPKKGIDSRVVCSTHGKNKTFALLTGITFEGDAVVQGRLSGTPAAPEFDGNLSAGEVGVRKIEFHDIDGKVRYQSGKAFFSGVTIHQGSSRYALDGWIELRRTGPVYSARLSAVRADVGNIVALFHKPLPLALSATGELSFSGTKDDFTGSAALSLSEGSAYGERFSRASLSVLLSKEKISFPQVVVTKGNGTIRGSGWIGFDGSYSASLTAADVDLSEVNILQKFPFSGRFSLTIASDGTFSKPRVNAEISMDGLMHQQRSLGAFSATARIENRRLTVACDLRKGLAKAAGVMELHDSYTWSVNTEIRTGELTPFSDGGDRDALSSMKVNATGKLSVYGKGFTMAAISGDALFHEIDLSLADYRVRNESDIILAVESGRVSVRSFSMTGPGMHITVQGGLTPFESYALTVNGRLNLSLLKMFFNGIEYGDGFADMKLAIGDTWTSPDISGEVRIDKGEVKIKDFPQKVSGLAGQIGVQPDKIVLDGLTGDFGGGTITLSGLIRLAGERIHTFSSRMTLDNITLRYPEGFSSALSGELYYDGDRTEQTLSGDIRINRALYDKRVEWKTMLVETFKSFSHKKKNETGGIGETRLNIRFHGKEGILIQNNVAKIPVEVDAFIRGTPVQPQLLGRMEARSGFAYFRRNDFKITHAAVDFVDPARINPILDIHAETRVREYVIKLSVTGAADHASIVFVSDPPLLDTSDILSLLALGKIGADLKGKGAEVGMSEAASFATGQFQDIFERRARSLTGLDRFQLDPYVSKNTSVPRVTVGKEIVQDKLYVTYSSNVGASTPEQLLRIEYILNKHFSLVGEQNEIGTIGGDVKFRFEFK